MYRICCPAGVIFVSASGSTGLQIDGNWQFVVGGFPEGDPSNPYQSNLPATLEIVTTAAIVGTHENRADLSARRCLIDDVFIPCEYEDGNTENNFDLANVNISTKPQVLGSSTSTPQVLAATTLEDTGSQTTLTTAISAIIVGAVVGLMRRRSNSSA
jgi:hypothetical protein